MNFQKRSNDNRIYKSVKVVTVVCITALLLFAKTTMADNQTSAISLHDSLGIVIDSTENETLKIIGPVSGLKWAKIFKTKSSKYKIHLLKSTDQQDQFIIHTLKESQYRRLKKIVKKRVNKLGREIPKKYIVKVDLKKINEAGNRQIVNFYNGSVLNALFLGAKSDTLLYQMMNGIEMEITDDQIVDVEYTLLDSLYKPKPVIDPLQSKHFIMPTALPMQGGSFSIANHDFFLPSVRAVITNYFAMSAGIFLLGNDGTNFYATAHAAFPLASFLHAGVGATLFNFDGNESETLGYSFLTLGKSRYNLTFGGGNELNARDQGPFYMLGGSIQLNNHFKLIMENLKFSDRNEKVLYMYGMRFFDKRLAIDLAFIGSVGNLEDNFLNIPWLGMTYTFNSK